MFEEEVDRYWKTIVDTIRDGIMVVDTAGSILSVNRALKTMTDYSHQELVGQKCSILNCSVFNLAREKCGEDWCLLFKTGAMNMRRCTIMRKDGTYVPVLKNASLLHDGKGRVIGAVETITDISEIVEKNKQIAAIRQHLRSEDAFRG